MTVDPNITAKITFTGNNAQFKNTGTQIMTEYAPRVIESGTAIDPNLYIAVVFSGDKQHGYQLNNIKLRIIKVCCDG